MLRTALSIVALVIGIYFVVRPGSILRFLMRVFNKVDLLHPPGPIFTFLVFVIGAILVVIGALNLF